MIFESIDCEWYAASLASKVGSLVSGNPFITKRAGVWTTSRPIFNDKKRDNNDDKDNGKDIEKYINKEN